MGRYGHGTDTPQKYCASMHYHAYRDINARNRQEEKRPCDRRACSRCLCCPLSTARQRRRAGDMPEDDKRAGPGAALRRTSAAPRKAVWRRRRALALRGPTWPPAAGGRGGGCAGPGLGPGPRGSSVLFAGQPPQLRAVTRANANGAGSQPRFVPPVRERCARQSQSPPFVAPTPSATAPPTAAPATWLPRRLSPRTPPATYLPVED